MIKLVYNKGHFAPLTFCDICGERIREAGGAAVIYPLNSEEGDDVPIFIVHKGNCFHQAEERLGGPTESGFDDLSIQMYYMLYNVGMSVAELKRIKPTAEMLSSL